MNLVGTNQQNLNNENGPQLFGTSISIMYIYIYMYTSYFIAWF